MVWICSFHGDKAFGADWLVAASRKVEWRWIVQEADWAFAVESFGCILVFIVRSFAKGCEPSVNDRLPDHQLAIVLWARIHALGYKTAIVDPNLVGQMGW